MPGESCPSKPGDCEALPQDPDWPVNKQEDAMRDYLNSDINCNNIPISPINENIVF